MVGRQLSMWVKLERNMGVLGDGDVVGWACSCPSFHKTDVIPCSHLIYLRAGNALELWARESV